MEACIDQSIGWEGINQRMELLGQLFHFLGMFRSQVGLPPRDPGKDQRAERRALLRFRIGLVFDQIVG